MTITRLSEIPRVTVRLYDGQQWNGVLHYSSAATPDRRHIDLNRVALEILTLDAMRLGRPRARSGAEKVLRRAGFHNPQHMYCFAFDHKIRYDRLA